MFRLALVRIFNALINTNLPGTGKLARLLAGLLLPKPKGAMVVETLEGFRIWVDPSADALGLENEIYRFGTYERGTLHVLRHFLRTDDCVVDVGANIGFMTLFASLRCRPGKVYAFEPLPDALQWLRKNLELNRVENVAVYDCALGSSDEKFQLFPGRLRNNRGSASLLFAGEAESAIDVLVKPLDSLLNADLHVHLMKIDVEGFELEVLRGARRLISGREAPALIIECCLVREMRSYTAEELFQFIMGINAYSIYKLQKGKMRLSALIPVRRAEDLPKDDNIFCFLPHQMERIAPLIKG